MDQALFPLSGLKTLPHPGFSLFGLTFLHISLGSHTNYLRPLSACILCFIVFPPRMPLPSFDAYLQFKLCLSSEAQFKFFSPGAFQTPSRQAELTALFWISTALCFQASTQYSLVLELGTCFPCCKKLTFRTLATSPYLVWIC